MLKQDHTDTVAGLAHRGLVRLEKVMQGVRGTSWPKNMAILQEAQALATLVETTLRIGKLLENSENGGFVDVNG